MSATRRPPAAAAYTATRPALAAARSSAARVAAARLEPRGSPTLLRDIHPTARHAPYCASPLAARAARDIHPRSPGRAASSCRATVRTPPAARGSRWQSPAPSRPPLRQEHMRSQARRRQRIVWPHHGLPRSRCIVPPPRSSRTAADKSPHRHPPLPPLSWAPGSTPRAAGR